MFIIKRKFFGGWGVGEGSRLIPANIMIRDKRKKITKSIKRKQHALHSHQLASNSILNQKLVCCISSTNSSILISFMYYSSDFDFSTVYFKMSTNQVF